MGVFLSSMSSESIDKFPNCTTSAPVWDKCVRKIVNIINEGRQPAVLSEGGDFHVRRGFEISYIPQILKSPKIRGVHVNLSRHLQAPCSCLYTSVSNITLIGVAVERDST
jgi:hypothetical protein